MMLKGKLVECIIGVEDCQAAFKSVLVNFTHDEACNEVNSEIQQ